MTRWLRYDRTVAAHRIATNKLQLLRSEKLGTLAWLVHGFSTRRGGVSRVYGGHALNLGFTQHDSRAAVERNRELFLKELGAATTTGRNHWPLVTATGQPHCADQGRRSRDTFHPRPPAGRPWDAPSADCQGGLDGGGVSGGGSIAHHFPASGCRAGR